MEVLGEKKRKGGGGGGYEIWEEIGDVVVKGGGSAGEVVVLRLESGSGGGGGRAYAFECFSSFPLLSLGGPLLSSASGVHVKGCSYGGLNGNGLPTVSLRR